MKRLNFNKSRIKVLIQVYRECLRCSLHNFDCMEGQNYDEFIYHETFHCIYAEAAVNVLKEIKKLFKERHVILELPEDLFTDE